MIRILLVDDEKVSLQSTSLLLISQIPYAEIQTAENAFEAIRKAKTTVFDIIIMDICMPEMDGLKAIEQIRKLIPNVKTIILSAYSLFEYAQKAITLGVTEYLLKPVPQERLISVIQKLIDEIQVEEKTAHEQLSEQERTVQLKQFAKQELFRKIVAGKGFSEERENCLEVLNVSLADTYVLVVQQNSQSAELMGGAKTRSVCESFQRTFGLADQSTYDDSIIVLANAAGQNHKEAKRAIENRCSYLISYLQKTEGISLRIGVGNRCDAKEHITTAFREAERSVQKAAFNSVVFYDVAENEKPKFAREVTADSLYKKIKNCDSNGVRTDIELLLERWFEEALYYGCNAKLNALEMLISIKQSIQKEYKCTEQNELLRLQECLNRISQTNSEKAIRKNVTEFIELAENIIVKQESEGGQSLIDRAARFISEHYCEDISLEMVADHLRVSQYYLSRLFNKEMGSSFTNYLTKLRVNKAKDLLEEGRLSIREVSAYVGYPNQVYFSKVFSRVVGQTPAKYKQNKE